MRRATPLAIALVIALALTGPASAGQSFDSKLTIKEKNGGLGGRLGSPKPKCQRGRTVYVYRNEPGPDPNLYTRETDRRGRWETGPFPIEPGTAFHAKVKRAELAGGPACKAAKSKTIVVE